MRAFTNIEEVRAQWGELRAPIFLNINFLQVYYEMHPQVKHLFVMSENLRLYAHIFQLSFNKTSNYLRGNPVLSFLIGLLNFKVLYMTNAFLTNVPAFISANPFRLKELLQGIHNKYSMVVIPDFLYEKLEVEEGQYTKIEVEEEMVLEIHPSWNSLGDYQCDLKKKYRNKVKSILFQTKNLEIRGLDIDELDRYAVSIQALFDQVASASRFKGPAFNTRAFRSFVEQGIMRVDGYFIANKLVGFSSVIPHEENLYSYFVGFDKTLNKSFPIYGRILVENIDAAIKCKKERLILGRTANEYKSNFGAYPVKSFVYLKIENRLLSFMLKPILRRLTLKPWLQRRPFIRPTDSNAIG